MKYHLRSNYIKKKLGKNKKGLRNNAKVDIIKSDCTKWKTTESSIFLGVYLIWFFYVFFFSLEINEIKLKSNQQLINDLHNIWSPTMRKWNCIHFNKFVLFVSSFIRLHCQHKARSVHHPLLCNFTHQRMNAYERCSSRSSRLFFLPFRLRNG